MSEYVFILKFFDKTNETSLKLFLGDTENVFHKTKINGKEYESLKVIYFDIQTP